MSLQGLRLCVVLALALPAYNAAAQAPAVVSRLQFQGNRFHSADSLLMLIRTRRGDTYSDDALKRDVQALRDTQFFQDVRLEVRDDPSYANAKIVTFNLVERPVIRQVVFHGVQSVPESEVFDALKDGNVAVSVGSPFDARRMQDAEAIIKELEAKHGHTSAAVKSTYERIPASPYIKIAFTVEEEPHASN